MKSILIILCCWVSFALGDGGVGGFEGGAIVSKKGSILFQEHSMFVNPATTKSLCLNDNDEYQAIVGFSEVNEKGQVVSVTRQMIFQDRVSKRKVCLFPDIELSKCPEFTEKTYVQLPNRILLTPPDSSGRQKEFKFTVPRCR